MIVDIPLFNLKRSELWLSRTPVDGQKFEARARGFELHAAAAPAARDFPTTASIRSASSVADRLNDAVLAAHDERIRLIRESISRARTAGDANAYGALRELNVRLDRAEAARRLATSRIVSPLACCDTTVAARASRLVSDEDAKANASAGIATAMLRRKQADDHTVAPVAPSSLSAGAEPSPRIDRQLQQSSRSARFASPAPTSVTTGADILPPQHSADEARTERRTGWTAADALARSGAHFVRARQLLEGDQPADIVTIAWAGEDGSDPLWPASSTQLAWALATLLALVAMASDSRPAMPERT